MLEVRELDCIWIWNEKFSGIGYQGLFTDNTKNYVTSPTRMNDGSMPNINDYDTFIVPRAKVTFKLLKLEDYQRLCQVLNMANEFPVRYFDKQIGDFVTHYMYCEPTELSKFYNVGAKVIGMLGYEISFIGTLNSLSNHIVRYCFDNNGTDIILDEQSYKWTANSKIKTGEWLTTKASERNLTLPNNTSFLGWNTKKDGTGLTYFPNATIKVYEDMVLYPLWKLRAYTIRFHDGTATISSGGSTPPNNYGMADQIAPIDTEVQLNKCEYTLDGYRFVGWRRQRLGSGAEYPDEGTVFNLAPEDGTIILYATWQRL